jgi:hypothetical protein
MSLILYYYNNYRCDYIESLNNKPAFINDFKFKEKFNYPIFLYYKNNRELTLNDELKKIYKLYISNK